MKVLGREVKFLRTVSANFKLEEMSPGHDISRFGELFDKSLSDTYNAQISVIMLLNEAYETRQHYLDASYESRPITREEVMMLTEEEFSKLSDEAINALNGVQTVELEESKKKETQLN